MAGAGGAGDLVVDVVFARRLAHGKAAAVRPGAEQVHDRTDAIAFHVRLLPFPFGYSGWGPAGRRGMPRRSPEDAQYTSLRVLWTLNLPVGEISRLSRMTASGLSVLSSSTIADSRSFASHTENQISSPILLKLA